MRYTIVGWGLALGLLVAGCGGGSGADNPGGGTGGGAGTGGTGGTAGAGGTAPTDGGGTGGTAGDSSVGGTAGSTGGVGGSAGDQDASTGGTAGDQDSGTGGTAGAQDSGTGGTAGDQDSGTGGTAGDQDASTGGTGGDQDASTGGTGGGAGTGGSGGDQDAGTGGGGGGWPTQCSVCHGSTNNPAPPKDTVGNIATTFAGVGAHQSHIATSDWHHIVECSECHTVPTTPFDPGVPTHMNGKDDVIWGSIAQQGAFDPTGLTCGNTYCHGGTLKPDATGSTTNRQPKWTTVDGSQAACGTSCHTLPPGGGHPAETACEACHTSVISSFVPGNPPTVVWANANLHIDGKLDVIGLNCTSCHGNAATGEPWPPLGTKGETQTTQTAVGAHQAHMKGGAWHREVMCQDCHAMPFSTTHSNGTTDFAWSTVASAGGSSPSYDTNAVTCQSTYCHGVTLNPPKSGGTIARTPKWTEVNGSWDACGTTCHTLPPGGGHPQSDQCQTCHTGVMSQFNASNPSASVWVNSKLHIDGKIDVTAMDCTSCHGNKTTNNPAPPLGTHGETQTSQSAVGAHAEHLGGSTWHRAGQCTDCHTVPITAIHANGIEELTWGTVASADLSSPSYNPASVTCTGSYCHGTTLMGAITGGAVARNPVWTTVNNTWDACGTTCHTNPPGGTHTASSACPTCHTAVIASFTAGNPPTVTWVNAALHVDGKVDVDALNCTSCHGDAVTNDPAPPLGTHGETQTSQAAVGAHQQHIGTSPWHRTGQCADCHAVPSSMTHSNGTTNFAWGAVSTSSNAAPAFNANNVTCTGSYCHGTTLLAAKTGGTINRLPVWTTVNNTWDACGTTCHTNPPGGTHPQSDQCDDCHSAVLTAYNPSNPSASIWANPNLHIDGKVDVVNLTCTSCHGDAVANNPAPPRGTQGETQTSQSAVGAHTQHLGASTWHRAGTCADCHATPGTTTHSNSVVDFSWGTPSNAGGATPAFVAANATCTDAYCHGTKLLGANTGGTVNRTPVWTTVNGSFDTCGNTCHTNPPGGTHPVATGCPTCHGTVISAYTAPGTATWVNAALHINGSVEVANLTCTSCHGDAVTSNAAPPRGTNGETQTSQSAVGAHAQHLGTSTWHRDGACVDCHTVPTSTGHSNTTVDFTWGAPANAGGGNTAFVAGNATCTNNYCHGTTLLAAKTGGTVSRTPVWTTVNGSFDACGTTCHTNPPGGTHAASTGCPTCHKAVIATFDPVTNAATWTDRTKHINGAVESSGYHDLANWETPKGNLGTTPNPNPNHHGTTYFLTNQQRDEHNTACTQCHGADLKGGTSGVSCDNTTCHGSDWRSCTFCHGTPPSTNNPPTGVANETTTNTLAVGRHVAHLTAGTSHVAFACAACHTVPAVGDVAHAAQYVTSANLATPGHHGDVTFTAPATGMTWNVAATVGTTPNFTARGSCVGSCHSNGRGGAPATTPYWAGGTWTAGSCTACHANPPSGAHSIGQHRLSGCTSCHPAANAATHMNGAINVNTTLTGTNMKPTWGGGNCSATQVNCTGSCHTTASRCW